MHSCVHLPHSECGCCGCPLLHSGSFMLPSHTYTHTYIHHSCLFKWYHVFKQVLMVASIPLAIEIVTTTTLALGSKGMYVWDHIHTYTIVGHSIRYTGIIIMFFVILLYRAVPSRCYCDPAICHRRHGWHGHTVFR